MGSDYDNLRKKVGIDRLDDNQRRRLYRDFVEHGGESVDQRPGKGAILRKAPPGEQVRDARRYTHERPGGGSGAGVSAAVSAKKPGVTRKAGASPLHGKRMRLSDAVLLYIRGLSRGVHTVGGRFSDRFVRFVGGEGKTRLMDLHVTAGSLIEGSCSVKPLIRAQSAGENSTFYEFVIRLRDLYREDEYGAMERAIAGKRIPSGPYLHVFREFFKRLYVLGQFKDLSRMYLLRGLDLQADQGKLDRELLARLHRKVREDVDTVFDDLLYRFHLVLCRLHRVYCPLYTQDMDDLLGLTSEDRIGFITRMERRKRAEELRKMRLQVQRMKHAQSDQEPEQAKAPRHVERGLPLVERAVSWYEEQHRFDEIPVRFIPRDDKLYRTLVLLEVFDREYSFVLTSGKISFNIDFREQKKIDVREDLNRAYLRLSEARHEVEDYLDLMDKIRETQGNLRLTVSQRSGMMETLHQKRLASSRKARTRVGETMKDIQSVLSLVINDYNTVNRLLCEPEQVLTFDEKYDRETLLMGRRVIEAVVEVFLFSAAFSFLLQHGELSGSGLTVEPPAGPHS